MPCPLANAWDVRHPACIPSRASPPIWLQSRHDSRRLPSTGSPLRIAGSSTGPALPRIGRRLRHDSALEPLRRVRRLRQLAAAAAAAAAVPPLQVPPLQVPSPPAVAFWPAAAPARPSSCRRRSLSAARSGLASSRSPTEGAPSAPSPRPPPRRLDSHLRRQVHLLRLLRLLRDVHRLIGGLLLLHLSAQPRSDLCPALASSRRLCARWLAVAAASATASRAPWSARAALAAVAAHAACCSARPNAERVLLS